MEPEMVEEHHPDAAGDEKAEKPTGFAAALQRGWTLGKKAAIAGAVVASAPLLVFPLVLFSALGLALAFPFGIYFASFACTDKLMSSLLPRPRQEEDGFEEEGEVEGVEETLNESNIDDHIPSRTVDAEENMVVEESLMEKNVAEGDNVMKTDNKKETGEQDGKGRREELLGDIAIEGDVKADNDKKETGEDGEGRREKEKMEGRDKPSLEQTGNGALGDEKPKASIGKLEKEKEEEEREMKEKETKKKAKKKEKKML